MKLRTSFVAFMFVLLSCGDQSFDASIFDFFTEEARPLNRREKAIYYGTAHCMGLDDPDTEPVIEYCTGGPDDEHCVDIVTNPRAIGTYRTKFDVVSIRPDWREFDGVLAHEFGHAILFRETGDPDMEHKHFVFVKCAPEEFFAG